MSATENAEWAAGYEAGRAESTRDHWSYECCQDWLSAVKPRNEWERGFNAAVSERAESGAA